MDTDIPTTLSLDNICQELGVMPQFLSDLSERAGSMYTTFDRPKRSGGTRKISASQGRLKRIQRLLLDELLARYRMPPHVHGCIKRRSTATNAKGHINQEVVINLDLSNFFGTVSSAIVQDIFRMRYHCDDNASLLLTKLTTLNNCLPQGAPTSPVLANLAALALDDDIIDTCLRKLGADKFTYTRYVDDITISGVSELVDLIPAFDGIITRQGFQRNTSKTRILRQSTRQWVTGLVVNRRLTPPKKVLRYLRQQIYYCKRYGLDGHCDWRGMPRSVFIQHLRGTIGYVRITQPDLADELKEAVDLIDPELGLSEDEEKLRLLKKVIDEERTVKFLYDGSQCRAGFAEINVDSAEGLIEVRGFQISPVIGWRSYSFAKITALEIEAYIS